MNVCQSEGISICVYSRGGIRSVCPYSFLLKCLYYKVCRTSSSNITPKIYLFYGIKIKVRRLNGRGGKTKSAYSVE